MGVIKIGDTVKMKNGGDAKILAGVWRRRTRNRVQGFL